MVSHSITLEHSRFIVLFGRCSNGCFASRLFIHSPVPAVRAGKAFLNDISIVGELLLCGGWLGCVLHPLSFLSIFIPAPVPVIVPSISIASSSICCILSIVLRRLILVKILLVVCWRSCILIGIVLVVMSLWCWLVLVGIGGIVWGVGLSVLHRLVILLRGLLRRCREGLRGWLPELLGRLDLRRCGATLVVGVHVLLVTKWLEQQNVQ